MAFPVATAIGKTNFVGFNQTVEIECVFHGDPAASSEDWGVGRYF